MAKKTSKGKLAKKPTPSTKAKPSAKAKPAEPIAKTRSATKAVKRKTAPKAPAKVKSARRSASPSVDVVALATKSLRGAKEVCLELETREFWDDMEAHDDELIERTYEIFLKRMKAYQKQLTATFGEPAEEGEDEHDAIPRNGILRHVIWDIRGRSLFLAVAHEDRELPCDILFGVTGR